MKKIILRSLAVIVILILIGGAYFYFTYRQFMSASEGEMIPDYENGNTALLVIDIQEGTSGPLSAHGGYGERTVPFIENVNQVIHTADSLGLIVVYIYHHNTNWLVNLMTDNVMAKGTPGTAFDKRLRVINDNRFSKSHTDGFYNPGLDAFLRENGVNHLIVTGLDVSYCVDKTSQGALNRGYRITVIKEAVIGGSVEVQEQMLQEYQARGIEVVTMADWIMGVTE